MLPYLKVLLVVPILLSAALLLTLSALILLRKRPILLRGSVFAWTVTAATGLVILSLVIFLISAAEASITCVGIVQILILLILIATIQRRVKGYFLVGTSISSFRQALHTALNELNLPFEETILGFNLPSLDDRLVASIAPRLGTAQIHLEGNINTTILDDIARRVDGYLRRTYGSQNEMAAFIYGAAGLVFLALTIYQWARF
jgi:hypothetical protein